MCLIIKVWQTSKNYALNSEVYVNNEVRLTTGVYGIPYMSLHPCIPVCTHKMKYMYPNYRNNYRNTFKYALVHRHKYAQAHKYMRKYMKSHIMYN